MAVDDADDAGGVFLHRGLYPQQIHIQFFAVAAQYPRDVPVMDRIGEVGVCRVRACLLYTSDAADEL